MCEGLISPDPMDLILVTPGPRLRDTAGGEARDPAAEPRRTLGEHVEKRCRVADPDLCLDDEPLPPDPARG
ncbi:MAG: hypothetical protein NVSMB25_21290 [Thermoleophilaceae bacterium]